MTSLDHSAAIFENSLNGSAAYTPPAPRYLGEKTERLPFPINALGKDLKTYLLSLHKATQAPIEVCFASLFSTINHAAQALAVVKLPQGQVKPLSCFFISVADSGERKTRADDDALKGTAQYQDSLLANYEAYKKLYKRTRAVYDEEKKKILQDKGLNQDQKNQILSELREPREPRYPILVTADPTMEGLIKLFYNGYPFVMLSTSEGGEFFGSYANNKENHLKTMAKLSRLWDGAPIDQVRKDSQLLFLKDQRLNMHISVQMSVFEAFMGQGVAEGQGFISRVLLSSPKPLAGMRAWLEPQEADRLLNSLQPFYNRILALYDLICFNEEDPIQINGQGVPESGLKLREIKCSSYEAIPLLRQFYAYGETKIGLCGFFQDVKDFVSKSQEHVLRIAATLTIFENPQALEVTLASIKTAIQLVSFYISEHLFIRDSGGETDEEILLIWIYKKYPNCLFERTSLLQRGPKKLRKASVLNPVLARLQEFGHIREASKGVFRLVVPNSEIVVEGQAA